MEAATWFISVDGFGLFVNEGEGLVPPFVGHKGAVIDAVATTLPEPPLPHLVRFDGARILLAGVAGDAQYYAPLGRRLATGTLLVELRLRPEPLHFRGSCP